MMKHYHNKHNICLLKPNSIKTDDMEIKRGIWISELDISKRKLNIALDIDKQNGNNIFDIKSKPNILLKQQGYREPFKWFQAWIKDKSKENEYKNLNIITCKECLLETHIHQHVLFGDSTEGIYNCILFNITG